MPGELALPPGLLFWCAFDENKLDADYLVDRVAGFEVPYNGGANAGFEERLYDPRIGFYIPVTNNRNSYRNTGTFAHGIGTGDFTLALWFRSSDTTSALRGILSINGINPTWNVMDTASGEMNLQWGGANLAGDPIPLDGTWQHLVCARSSGTLHFWINGVKTSNSPTRSTSMSDGDLNIGNDGFAAGSEALGDIADVRIYNRFYTGPEVLKHWEDSRRQYPIPLGLFEITAGTTKTVSDTGAGADALAQLAVALTAVDAGGGADGFTGQAALGLADGGAGLDGAAIAVQLTLLEVAAGADVQTMSVALAVSETASGADVVSTIQSVLVVVADMASGADAAAVSAQVTLAETGGGLDGVNLSIYLPMADVGAGADAVNILTGVLVSLAEAGSGSDAISHIGAQLQMADTGSGLDGPSLGVTLTVTETGSGADVVGVLMGTLIAVADAASGADALGSVSVQLNLAESGLGADGIGQLAVALSLLDAGAGLDVVTKLDTQLDIITITFTLARRGDGLCAGQTNDGICTQSVGGMMLDVLKEKVGIRPRWVITKYKDDDAFKRGEHYEQNEIVGNLLLNEGITALQNLLIGAAETAFSNANAHIGVGDDATAAAAGQTGLQAATNLLYKAVEAGYPSVSAQTTTWRGYFHRG